MAQLIHPISSEVPSFTQDCGVSGVLKDLAKKVAEFILDFVFEGILFIAFLLVTPFVAPYYLCRDCMSTTSELQDRL